MYNKVENFKNKLFYLLKKSLKFSYSPYSKIKVCSCVISKNNNFFIGTNIENCSYGLTICAERVAIFKAISKGEKKFKNLIIMSNQYNKIMFPCGACRQVMSEFFDLNVLITIIDNKFNILFETTFDKLLPNIFKI